jgi:hypothetical protein
MPPCLGDRRQRRREAAGHRTLHQMGDMARYPLQIFRRGLRRYESAGN